MTAKRWRGPLIGTCVGLAVGCAGRTAKDGANQAGSGGLSETGGSSGSPGETGGNIGSAGVTAAGGSAASGGNAMGGGGAAGGGGKGDPIVIPTEGCGKAPNQALGEWQKYIVPLDGETLGAPQTTHTETKIFVRLPPDYDNTQPYRIVYQWGGCDFGDTVEPIYDFWDATLGGDPNAINVKLKPPDPAIEGGCHDTLSGADSIEWETLDHAHTFVSERFCVDNNRVYGGGYNDFGSLTDMYGCYFAGIPDPPRKFLPDVALRGAMHVTGCGDHRTEDYQPCNGPSARLYIHDEFDSSPSPLLCAQADRDRALLQNGCTGGADGLTEPWGADFFIDGSCVKYSGCPAEYPVIFCTTMERIHLANFDNAIPGFTRFLNEIEASAP